MSKPCHIRPLWVLLAALCMGGIAFAVAQLGLRTGLLWSLEDPALRFWVFEAMTGAGFGLGGFAVALISPGRTTREPVIAAVLAYLGQTGALWYADQIAMTGKVFAVTAAVDGALAWIGAWLGERASGTA